MAEGYRIWLDRISTSYGTQPIQLSAIKRADDSAEIGFFYLDQNDGGVIELLHTKYEGIECYGDIMGAGGPVKLGKFYNKPPRYKIPPVFLIMILMAMPTIFTVAILVTKDWKLGMVEWVFIGALWLMWLLQLTFKLWPDFRYLKFPKWSHFKDEQAIS